jgi:hypothetical protein
MEVSTLSFIIRRSVVDELRYICKGSIPTISAQSFHTSQRAHKTKGKPRAITPDPLVEQPVSSAARRGWLAHQSIFPASARSPSPIDASGLTPSPVSLQSKDLAESPPSDLRNLHLQSKVNHHDSRVHIGQHRVGRRESSGSSSTGSFTDGSYDDDDIPSMGSSALEEDDSSDAGYDDVRRMHDPMAEGVEGVEIPPRLEVLQDKMGYWGNGKESIGKYHGRLTPLCYCRSRD